MASVQTYLKRGTVRGKEVRHDVSLEMSYLASCGSDTYKCFFARCGKTLKTRRGARSHVRLHLFCMEKQSLTAHDSVMEEFASTMDEATVNADQLKHRDGTMFEDSGRTVASSENLDLETTPSRNLTEEVPFDGSDNNLSDADDDMVEESIGVPEWDLSTIEDPDELEEQSAGSATSEIVTPTVRADVSDLYNLCKLVHGVSDRAAIDFYELAKLNLNNQQMKQTDITKAKSLILDITECIRCSYCGELLRNDTCPGECPATPDGDCFAVASLSDQLKKTLDGKTVKFWDANTYRKGGVISDCTDGSAYYDFIRKVLPGTADYKVVTLTLNTDGVQLFNNSNKSIWPVILAINELPKETRYQMQNMLTYAIWEGLKGEPQNVPFQAIFIQLAKDLELINRQGLFIRANGELVRVKFFITRIAADTPAKAAMLNLAYPNGFWGCSICEEPGFTAKKGKGHNHSYAPQVGSQVATRRTRKRMLRQAKKTAGSVEAKGMRGRPFVSALNFFDSATGMLIDDLHAVYEGITKKVLHMWTKRSGYESCRLGESQIELILQRMKAIRPPSSVPTFPTGFNFSDWKGHDYRSWLLFASLPCCKGIVKDEFLTHWGMLVEAISLLSKADICVSEDLPRATRLLIGFCSAYSELYGENTYGINQHYMEHLVEYVELHGSLADGSLFAFESFNGFLTRQCHGTNIVRKTILRQILTYQTLQRNLHGLTEPAERRYVARLRRQRIGIPTEGSGWRAFGRPIITRLDAPVGQFRGCGVHETVCFNRIELSKIVIWTSEYIRAKKTSSEYFFLRHKDTSIELIVRIQKIFLCRTCRKIGLLVENIRVKPFKLANKEYISHLFVGRSFSNEMYINPFDYGFTTCCRIENDVVVTFAVYSQWQNSD